jgi:hypothetical protein
MESPSWPEELLAARERVKAAAGVDEQRLLPAWRRYTGAFYQAAGDALSDAVAAGGQIVILSGGYGVVRAEEQIGTYDRLLRFSDWLPRLLDDLLAAEAARVQARSVVAFAGDTTGYARLVRRTPWRRTGVADALLVTVVTAEGGAMRKVPKGLGQAFRAFWQQRPGSYPPGIRVDRLV